MLTRQMIGHAARGDHLRLLGGLSSITTLTLDEKQISVYDDSGPTHDLTYSSFWSNSQVAALQRVNGFGKHCASAQ